jgi:lipopolysaccharide heptosyltransferase II
MNNHKNILVTRLSSIGDIVLTTAFLRILKNTIPNSTITFLTDNNYESILKFNKRIDYLITYDKLQTNKERNLSKNLHLSKLNIDTFDITFDLHNNFRTRKFYKGITKEMFKIDKQRLTKLKMVYLKSFPNEIKHKHDIYLETLNSFNPKDDNLGLEFWFESDLNSYLNQTSNKIKSNIIGIAPGSKHFTKMWNIEKFKDIANLLSSNFSVQLFGSKEDIGICNFIQNNNEKILDLSGKLTLLETAKLIDKCDVLISNDSGLMHIASARQTKVLAIFGSTVKELGFSPFRVQNEIVEKELNCRPCSHIGRENCPKGHFNCMNMISVEDVYSSFEKLICI